MTDLIKEISLSAYKAQKSLNFYHFYREETLMFLCTFVNGGDPEMLSL
jgi:hypothetical protein